MTPSEKAVKEAGEKSALLTLAIKRKAGRDASVSANLEYVKAYKVARAEVSKLNGWDPAKLTTEQRAHLETFIQREAIEFLAALHLGA